VLSTHRLGAGTVGEGKRYYISRLWLLCLSLFAVAIEILASNFLPSLVITSFVAPFTRLPSYRRRRHHRHTTRQNPSLNAPSDTTCVPSLSALGMWCNTTLAQMSKRVNPTTPLRQSSLEIVLALLQPL